MTTLDSHYYNYMLCGQSPTLPIDPIFRITEACFFHEISSLCQRMEKRKILKPEVDVNTYYYYCGCCCCRWWHLLLGLLVLRPSISSLLQSATSVITKRDSFFYYKVRWSVIKKCDSFFITKCDKCYYRVRQILQSVTILLQSATIITKCDSTHVFWTGEVPDSSKFNCSPSIHPTSSSFLANDSAWSVIVFIAIFPWLSVRSPSFTCGVFKDVSSLFWPLLMSPTWLSRENFSGQY